MPSGKSQEQLDSLGALQLTPEQMVELARRMVAETNPSERQRLLDEMEAGFYGDEKDA